MSTMEERMSMVEHVLAEIAEGARAKQEADRVWEEKLRAWEAQRQAWDEQDRVWWEERQRAWDANRRAWEEQQKAWERKRNAWAEQDRAEARAFREERQELDRKSDRKWGELANKMGTLVEDIVAPGLSTVFQNVFGLERLDAYGQRVHRTHRTDPGRRREFDYVASSGGLVLVNETKSTVRPEDIPTFVAVLEGARDFLPEADGRSVVGALAGFSVEPSLVTAGERQGLLMFGLGTGLLRVLNTPGFQPRRF